MANKPKQTGTLWETTVVNYLNELEFSAKRTGSAEVEQSDIHCGDWTFEAKAEQRIDLPGYLKQLAASVDRRPEGVHYQSAVWVKNRRHSTGDAYVVMGGHNFRQLMVYIDALESIVAQIEGAFLA
jgi:hypothetical protein